MNILFDLDGTLTDSRPGIVACIAHALQSLGQPVPPEAELRASIGAPLRAVFVDLLPSRSTQVEAAVAAYRERFASVGMFENTVYEGVRPALALLAETEADIFLATSKPRVFAERILEHFGLANYFTAIYGSELSGELSVKGELIAHVLSASGLSAANTMMVGDRSHDIRGALQNGVSPVGVLWGYGSREELTQAGAGRLVDHPRDLGRLLEQRFD